MKIFTLESTYIINFYTNVVTIATCQGFIVFHEIRYEFIDNLNCL